MKNLFNKLFKSKIPTGETKEIDTLESFTVKWEVRGEGYSWHTYFRVFPTQEIAREFERSLKDATQLTKADIITKIYKNE